MQISTNWSVSHLRHWRPPVASSGYYLYRYTGRSWFKSKQSALRSILPNANIHHNEKRPGRGQRTDWTWCLLLTSRRTGQHRSPLLGSMKQHTPNRTEKMSNVGLQCESADDGWVSPRKKAGSQTTSRGKPTAHCDNRKKVGGTYRGGGQLRLESLLNVGSRGEFYDGGRGNGGG